MQSTGRQLEVTPYPPLHAHTQAVSYSSQTALQFVVIIYSRGQKHHRQPRCMSAFTIHGSLLWLDSPRTRVQVRVLLIVCVRFIIMVYVRFMAHFRISRSE